MLPRRAFALGIAAVLVIVALVSAKGLIEWMNADEIMVIQSIRTGELALYTDTGGIKPQLFGKVTRYHKRSIYSFDQPDEKNPEDCSNGIPVRFNDGGHGKMCGSVQYELPLDPKNLIAIHTKFGSQEAVEKHLVETITGKAVYLSGPLMSSRESYAEKRSNLIFFVEDQVQNGVYRTTQREAKTKDPITGVEKTVTVVEIVIGLDGKPLRQEEAVLSEFGIKAFNFAIKRLPYDSEVEKQIKQQQQIAMDVQTSMADAKKAEQRTITVIEQGKASAAEAKWLQEKENARLIAEAEQKKTVARLAAEAAEQTKRQNILLGEGEAERKRLVMQADGALKQKLDAWLEAQKSWAEAYSKAQQPIVPNVVMGSGTGSAAAGSGLQQFMEILAAKDLGVDMGVGGTEKTRGAK